MLELKPVKILGESSEARLVFHEDALVALLLCLSEDYESEAGHWHLEWGHNGVSSLEARTFKSLTEAQENIARQIEI